MRLRLLLVLTLASAALSAGTGIHNLELVGKLPLGGFNADVWVHGNFAYVGSWGSGSLCPATGVKVVDLSDPASPKLSARIAAHPNTTAEDVVVRHVENAFFRGDLLAVGLQSCVLSQAAQRGLEIFDVTDPRNPKSLASYDTGSESRGVHELDMVARPDGRVLVLLATITRFRLIEATNPSRPTQLSDWNLSERLNETPSSSKFCHSALASTDGNMAILSYWDAGVVLLDIADPSTPRFLGRTQHAPGEQRNANSVALSPGSNLMLTADEDLNPGDKSEGFKDWGYLRVYDISDPAAPKQLSAFMTANAHTDAVTGPADSGSYTIRNPVLTDNLGYLSWYSDGIRIVDLADPRAPQEVAYFVPPDTRDPFGVYPAKAEVWGVVVQPERRLVLASDMNYGLYVLRPLEPRPYRSGVVNGASFVEGGAVAPGTIASLLGTQLSGAEAASTGSELRTQLAGTVVRVNGVPAPLLYSSPGQLNFLIPPTIELGLATVVVENLGRAGREMSVLVAEAAPGIFTQTQDGKGMAVVQRVSDDSFEMYATGLGTTSKMPEVRMAGRAAEVVSFAPVAGSPGLFRFVVRAPEGLRGDVEVVMLAGGRSSNSVALSIE